MASTSVVRKVLPNAIVDGSEGSNLGDRYGAQIVQPYHGAKQALAEQGSYFIATNPTPETGIALTTSIIVFAETAGAVGDILLVKNTETLASGNLAKRIYPDYLRIKSVTTAPTSATDWFLSGVLDYSLVRYTSGGSQITPINVNGDSSLASVATIYFGALTTAIPASRRLLFARMVLPRLIIVKDDITIVFGGINPEVVPVNSAAIMSVTLNVPPCVIGPAQNLVIKAWGNACAAAPEFEFEFGYWEK